METFEIGGKIRILTKLPAEVRQELKTRKQWLELGFLPVDAQKGGTLLRPNGFTSKQIRYYHSSEVRKGSDEEIAVALAPINAHRRARAQMYYQRQKERNAGQMKGEQCG